MVPAMQQGSCYEAAGLLKLELEQLNYRCSLLWSQPGPSCDLDKVNNDTAPLIF
jgi:hypothetical protein